MYTKTVLAAALGTIIGFGGPLQSGVAQADDIWDMMDPEWWFGDDDDDDWWRWYGPYGPYGWGGGPYGYGPGPYGYGAGPYGWGHPYGYPGSHSAAQGAAREKPAPVPVPE